MIHLDMWWKFLDCGNFFVGNVTFDLKQHRGHWT